MKVKEVNFPNRKVITITKKCPQCKGKGCSDCDEKGVIGEEIPVIEEKGTSISEVIFILVMFGVWIVPPAFFKVWWLFWTLLIFGFVQGALVITTTTIDGDIARKDYPDLKSSFYAFLISCWNAGQALGNFLGALLFALLANYITTDFNMLYLSISLFGATMLFMSYLCFRSIDPKSYEFEHVISEERDIYFT